MQEAALVIYGFTRPSKKTFRKRVFSPSRFSPLVEM